MTHKHKYPCAICVPEKKAKGNLLWRAVDLDIVWLTCLPQGTSGMPLFSTGWLLVSNSQGLRRGLVHAVA